MTGRQGKHFREVRKGRAVAPEAQPGAVISDRKITLLGSASFDDIINKSFS